MRAVIHCTLFLAVLVKAPGLVLAQVESGPAAGTRVEALKVVVATGDAAGKELDFSADRKDKPTVYAFFQADKWDRPMARFLKVLDKELGGADVHIVAIWLTEDVEKSKGYLPKAQGSLQLAQTTFAVHPGDKNGPEKWGINSDAHLTVVVARGNKVIASIGYRSVNETDVPEVMKKVKP